MFTRKQKLVEIRTAYLENTTNPLITSPWSGTKCSTDNTSLLYHFSPSYSNKPPM